MSKLRSLSFILLMLLFIRGGPAHGEVQSSGQQPRAVQGVLDLTGWDINTNGKVCLDGQWEFYWKTFYTSADFTDIDTNTDPPILTGYFDVPGKWNNYRLNNGTKLTENGYATYRLIVKHGPTTDELAVKIPELYSAYRMYINGRLIAHNGIPGTSKATTVPQFLPVVKNICSNEPVNEIIIHVANFHYRYGGVNSCYLGNKERLDDEQFWYAMINGFVIGVLLVISFYYLCLFFFRSIDKANLYFGLLCLVMTFCHLSTQEFLSKFFYDKNIWHINLRIDFITYYLALAISALFLHSLFTNEFNTKVAITITAVSVAFSIPSFFLPVKIISIYIDYTFQVFTLVVFVYFYYVMIRAILNNRYASVLTLAGYTVVVITAFNDGINTSFNLQTPNLVPYGIVVFSFFQAVMLSTKFNHSYKKNKKLSAKLRGNIKKLNKLNKNLEAEVTKRTRKIKKAKEKIEKLNKQKTDFFINLSHEIKTPLTLITNYLEKYIKGNSLTVELKIIKQNIDKLLFDMINFFDVLKVEKGFNIYDHSFLCNVSEILDKKIKLFIPVAQKRHIRITGRIKDNILLQADPVALDRILNNLIDNAIKYNKEAGSIDIILDEDDRSILFTIKDTGTGINENQLSKIFLPYYQISRKKTSIQGIGMGLSIVKHVIDEIGGTIRVHSMIDEGTTFDIILKKIPIKEDVTVMNDFIVSEPIDSIETFMLDAENYDETKKIVFVLDDNTKLLSFIQKMMKDTYNVFFATNGKDALVKIKRIPKPDIIISDIMMDEMDGYQFYEELIKIPKYDLIPFIFLSARSSFDEKIKALHKGAVDYIAKPFLIDVLLAKIHSIIRIQEALKEDNLVKLGSRFYEFLESLQTFNKTEPVDKPYNNSLNGLYYEYGISKREVEVISLLKLGLEHKEIACRLEISVHTVRTYINRIYEKCNVNNKVELLNIFT